MQQGSNRNMSKDSTNISKSLFGQCRVCDISGGDKPRPYENLAGGVRRGGVYLRLSLPSGGNLDNTLRIDRIRGRDLPDEKKRQVRRQGTWTFLAVVAGI